MGVSINDDAYDDLRAFVDDLLDATMAKMSDGFDPKIAIRALKPVKAYKSGYRMGVIMTLQVIMQAALKHAESGPAGDPIIGKAMKAAMRLLVDSAAANPQGVVGIGAEASADKGGWTFEQMRDSFAAKLSKAEVDEEP